jgi:PAS domain S-box-containing protein
MMEHSTKAAPAGRLSTRAPLFMLLMVLPLLGFTLYTEMSLREERQAALYEEAKRWLSIIEDEQTHVFNETSLVLDLLIDSDTVMLEPNVCMAAMARQAQHYPSYLTVTISDAGGTIRCASTPTALGYSIADRLTFHRVREGEKSVVGVSSPSRYSGKFMIPLVKPYQQHNRFAGAVSGLIDIGWLEELIQRKPLPPDVSLLVADRSGVVFARAPGDSRRRSLLPDALRPLLAAVQPGVGEFQDGQRRLITAYSPFGTGLKDTLTILSIDRDARMAPVDRAAFRSLLLSTSVVVGAACATGFALRRYLRYRERVEQALRRVQEHLSLVLSSVEAGIWEWDVRSDTMTWSTGLFHLFDVDPTTFSPSFTAWLERLPPEERRPVQDLVLDLFSRRLSDFRLEHRVLCQDGTPRWLLSLGRVLYADGGEALRMVGLTVDITQTKRTEDALRQSEERYRSLVESQTDIVVRLDANGCYTFVNDTACQIFGRPRDELIGLHWTHFAISEDTGPVEAAISRMNTTPQRRETVEGRVKTIAGVRCYLWEGGPIFDDAGNFIEHQAVGRDITERKMMEQRLRLTRDAAERSTAAKSRFLAAASHDLRQPMQSLVLFATALHQHVGPTGREQLAHLERSLEALKGLLDSLLDVSRLDAGLVKPVLVDFPLNAVLDELDASSRSVAEDRRLNWSVTGCQGTVHSDRILLTRLLRNLVQNALRYTESGEIAIRCHPDGDHLLIQVEDTGIGIPEDQVERIFDEFVQIGNVERNRQQGLGLGLSIVRRISQLLDCRVDVHSEEGKGSVFTVRVPRGMEDCAPPEASGSGSLPGLQTRSNLLILVIDDEIMVGTALQAVLEGWGCKVIMTSSAGQAAERLQETGQCPDIILSDYRLGGGLLGTDAITRLRHLCGREVPALLLTGETSPTELRDAAARGLNILHKPVTPQLLAEALSEVAGHGFHSGSSQ